MKSFILFAAVIVSGFCSFAQNTIAAKATATGDTVKLSNIAVTDTVRMLYTHPSPGWGYTAGTNGYDDSAFAERYDFNHNDTSVTVIGVFARFGGKVSPTSATNITLRVWRQGPSTIIGPHTYFSGFPTDVMNSLVVPVPQLGITATGGTLKQFMFAGGSDFIQGGFFVGYSMDNSASALAGDTLALASSIDGHRAGTGYTLKYTIGTAGDTTAIDTTFIVQNATLWSDGAWRDNYKQNDHLFNNLAIFPIIKVGHANSVKGVTHNQLTLFGAYPNPANDHTNIRFGLGDNTEVTLTITDMSGRIVNMELAKQLAAGEHIIRVNTSAFSAGEYLYLVSTSAGDGMAGKFIVSK